jgi:hypothetical protein
MRSRADAKRTSCVSFDGSTSLRRLELVRIVLPEGERMDNFKSIPRPDMQPLQSQLLLRAPATRAPAAETAVHKTSGKRVLGFPGARRWDRD